MTDKHADSVPEPQSILRDGPGKAAFKNQNPNQNHNVKKQSMGPNTKR